MDVSEEEKVNDSESDSDSEDSELEDEEDCEITDSEEHADGFSTRFSGAERST